MIVNNSLINFYRDGNDYELEIRDLDNASDSYYAIKTFKYTSDVEADEGSLVLLDNTVLIEPHNKQLNLIDGEWYINDFVSTTPLFNITKPEDLDDFQTGSIKVVSNPEFDDFYFNTIDITTVPNVDTTLSITYNGHTTTVPLNNIVDKNDIYFNIKTYINTVDAPNNFLKVEFVGEVGDDIRIKFISKIPGSPPSSVLLDCPQIIFETNNVNVINLTLDTIEAPTFNIRIGQSEDNIALVSGMDLKTEIFNTVSAFNSLDNYNVTSDDDTVYITRKTSGDFGTLVIQTMIPNNTGTELEIKNITGGLEPEYTGNLKQNTNYWYTLRYRYFDGHITKTCFPKYVKTNNIIRRTELIIEPVVDLDQRYALVEIFRKEEGNEFFLIDTVRPDSENFIYVDDGKENISLLNEQNYVWSFSHKTHEVARDRYLRANVNYAPRRLTAIFKTTLEGTDTNLEEQTVPRNVRIEVFARGRNNDGLETFHEKIGEVVNNTQESKILVDQQTLADEDTKEIGYYAKYNNISTDEGILFNSPELYNTNIPSIATKLEDEAEQDKPINPKLFLGWKRIYFVQHNNELKAVTYDFDWANYKEGTSTHPDNINRFFAIDLDVVENVPSFEVNGYPDYITVNVFGNLIKYVKKIKYNENTVVTPISTWNLGMVYEMAYLDALKASAFTTQLKTKLLGVKDNIGVSTDITNDRLINQEFDVVGIQEKSCTPLFPDLVDNSRVYLQFSADSDLNKINNIEVNIRNFGDEKQDAFHWINNLYNTPSYFFKLVGLSENQISDTVTEVVLSPTISRFESQYGLINEQSQLQELLIYLGRKANELGSKLLEITGYTKKNQNNFLFYSLNPWNIYEQIIEEKDLQQLQFDFPNQIIWSEPYILGTNASGNRTFSFLNFLNLNRDYGAIVSIKYVGNKLIVFCEKGVAIVNIGEILTQQPSGQTAVDSSRFLSGQQWVLTNISDIQKKSIKRYENLLFFSDSEDVWMYDGQFKNITNGAIKLASLASQVGAIDPENKEYRISDGEQTWAFNIELNEWQGPYTYIDQLSGIDNKTMLSINNDDLVEHNQTNRFHNTEYETIVESVSNDLNEPSFDKLFRKFYLDLTGSSIFSYGKNYDTQIEKDLSEVKTRNSNYHIGLSQTETNAKRIYWKIKSKAEDFVLRMVSFMWTPRERR